MSGNAALIERHFGRRVPIESIDLENLRSLSRLAQLVGAPMPTSARNVAARGEAAPGAVGASTP
jgi:hypothetical protein